MLLEARAAEQERAEREERRQRAIKSVTASLPKRVDAAGQFEVAVHAVGEALQKLDQTRAKIISDWPDDLEKPWAMHLSLDRALADLHQCFAACDPKWRWGDRLTETLKRIKEQIDGFAERERKHHAELLEDLKQPAPQPLDPEESEAA